MRSRKMSSNNTNCFCPLGALMQETKTNFSLGTCCKIRTFGVCEKASKMITAMLSTSHQHRPLVRPWAELLRFVWVLAVCFLHFFRSSKREQHFAESVFVADFGLQGGPPRLKILLIYFDPFQSLEGERGGGGRTDFETATSLGGIQ